MYDLREIVIDDMQENDIAQIRCIEKQSFCDLWPEDGFHRELENKKVALYLTAKIQDKVLGYMGSWLIMEEAHITTFAVDPTCRGNKIATLLMYEFMCRAIARGTHWSTLEVNEHNTAAIKLYEKFGYKTVGRRKKYYSETDDGLLMWVGSLHKIEYQDTIGNIRKELSLE